MIAFDIGTTFCKVAYVDQAGKPCIVANGRGDHATPSVLYYPPDGSEPLIGKDAVEQSYLDPENGVASFKLDLGSQKNLLNNGKVITPEKATEDLIRALKQNAEKALGREITQAVATCPANFRDDQKQALLDAFKANGIEILRLLPEPTGGGYAYSLDKQGSNASTLIYDFGGGTFDVSILKMDGKQITILSTQGVAKLGGNDINDVIHHRVLDDIENQCGHRPSAQDDPLFFHDLNNRVEQAKISLGNRKEVALVAAYKGNNIIVKLTQDWFNSQITPLIRKSLDAVDQALQGAGLQTADINYLVMVGGTTRLPFIQEKVAEHTGLVPKVDIDPDKAVVYGGALASIMELKKRGQTAKIRGQEIPAPDLFYSDVTGHPVGCSVVDKSTAKRKVVNSVIIARNTPIPTTKTDCYFLEHEDQGIAHIEILQGEPDADRDTCLVIGALKLENLPKEQKKTQRIKVDFSIDENGMVEVTATDLVSSKSQTVSVDYKKGVKPKPQTP